MRSSRLVVPVVIAATLTLIFPSRVGAQTRPDVDVYDGPKCFATILPAVTPGTGRVSGSRDPGKRILSNGDSLFVRADDGVVLEEGSVYDAFRVEARSRIR